MEMEDRKSRLGCTVTWLQPKSQLHDQPSMWTKEPSLEDGAVFDGNHRRKKKEYSFEKKQEDKCQGLVGFAKWVDALKLFATSLFFLISIPISQND